MKSRSAEAVFEKKRERRRQLARLPFEEKIEIVVRLQKAAAGIRGDRARRIWPIGGPLPVNEARPRTNRPRKDGGGRGRY